MAKKEKPESSFVWENNQTIIEVTKDYRSKYTEDWQPLMLELTDYTISVSHEMFDTDFRFRELEGDDWKGFDRDSRKRYFELRESQIKTRAKKPRIVVSGKATLMRDDTVTVVGVSGGFAENAADPKFRSRQHQVEVYIVAAESAEDDLEGRLRYLDETRSDTKLLLDTVVGYNRMREIIDDVIKSPIRPALQIGIKALLFDHDASRGAGPFGSDNFFMPTYPGNTLAIVTELDFRFGSVPALEAPTEPHMWDMTTPVDAKKTSGDNYLKQILTALWVLIAVVAIAAGQRWL